MPSPGLHRAAADGRDARLGGVAARCDRGDAHDRARRQRRRHPPPRLVGRKAAPHRAGRRARRFRRRDGRDGARIPSAARLRPNRGRAVPRQAHDADDRSTPRHLGAGIHRRVQRRGGRRLDLACVAPLGPEAAIVGGGDRHQDHRGPRRLVAGARESDRRPRRVPARAVREGRRLPRRLHRASRRGGVLGRVAVRPAADADRARRRHLHHAAAPERFRGGGSAPRGEPAAADRIRPGPRRVAQRVHRLG